MLCHCVPNKSVFVTFVSVLCVNVLAANCVNKTEKGLSLPGNS